MTGKPQQREANYCGPKKLVTIDDINNKDKNNRK